MKEPTYYHCICEGCGLDFHSTDKDARLCGDCDVEEPGEDRPLKQDEFDDEELCAYCDLKPGVFCYGGQPVSCEGSRCDEAYEAYVDNWHDEHDYIKTDSPGRLNV